MINLRTHIKRFGYLAIWLLILTACRPKGILSSKQMEDIFVDLHTAEAILQEAGYNYGHDEAVRGYYLVILQKHNTTQAQFDSSLIWYTANPTIFDKIYPKVIARLQDQHDAYVMNVENHADPQLTIDEWMDLCIKGYNVDLTPKKSEKKPKKFAYIKN